MLRQDVVCQVTTRNGGSAHRDHEIGIGEVVDALDSSGVVRGCGDDELVRRKDCVRGVGDQFHRGIVGGSEDIGGSALVDLGRQLGAAAGLDHNIGIGVGRFVDLLELPEHVDE